jgi:thioesterase domain-containing protein
MQLVQQRLGWLGPARNGDGADHLAYMRSRQEHEQVNRGYQMQVYPGDITLFRAIDEPDPKLDWRRFTGGELRIHDVPGDHFGMLQEPNVEVLAKELEASLEGEARPVSLPTGVFRGRSSTAPPDSWRLA